MVSLVWFTGLVQRPLLVICLSIVASHRIELHWFDSYDSYGIYYL